MSSVTSEIRMRTLDRLAPATQAAIRAAQQEAARLRSQEVSPELLLFGVLLQGHEGVRRVLRHLGIDLQTMRSQAVEIFNLPGDAETEKLLAKDLPLSGDALHCIEWGISFATYVRAPSMLPEHLLLGTLRHPRTQPLLALLLPGDGVIPTPVIEDEELDYPCSMDQLIHGRVREQSLVSLSNGRPRQILRGFERPTLLFADIIGDDMAKKALREAVDFLRVPRLARGRERNYLCGTVLVGSQRRHRSMLVQAVAGEAVVPLLSLSFSALAGMIRDLDSGSMQLEDFDLPEDERNLLANVDSVQRGRRMIAYIFERARKDAPCVLLLDDIDAMYQLNTETECQQWLKQMLVEMDCRDNHPSMVVIAATEHPGSLDQALMHPARFEKLVVLEDSAFIQSRPCPSCLRTALPGWKHCMYCGSTLARVCPRCKTLLPELEDTRFCFECGGPLT
jgi:hypothetical protein